MGKQKKASKSALDRRRRLAQARRLSTLVDIVHRTVDTHRTHEGVDAIIFMVVHGSGPGNAEIISFPPFDFETSSEILQTAFEGYETWGRRNAVLESAQLVQGAVQGLTNAVNGLVARDPSYAGTAVVGAHPAGAACMGYTLGNGMTADDMRRRVFRSLGLVFPGMNADAEITTTRLLKVV